MRRTRSQTEREPTTALINIVFLILIFFMVTGSLAAPPLASPDYVESEAGECCSPPDALIITADGEMFFRNQPVSSVEAYLDQSGEDAPARLLPDKALPAADLLRLVTRLQNAGASRIILMTETLPR
nr:biopolymer transporter ExbD [uncultured Hyphomonas sp.]